MSTFEELSKRLKELESQQSDVSRELNSLKYKWYDAYIATDDVKNKLGKCFKVKDKDIYYKIIAPAPLKSGRAFVDVCNNHWVCITTSEAGIDYCIPEMISEMVPITVETKYISFKSEYFKDEEITPAQFDEALESNLGKLKSFINMKIIEGKTNPKAEMLFDF
jgi:hypothetical protein